MRKPAAALLVLAALHASAQESPQKTPKLISAEFIGCSGEPDDGYTTSTARRITSNNEATFLVSYISGCGLSGKDLEASWDNGELNLRFDLYSPDGTVVMCACEYWAKFKFGPEAMQLRKVRVNGVTAKLLGEWPSGR